MERQLRALESGMVRIKSSPVMDYISEAYLYGSVARRSATWESDIDILLVLAEEERENRRLRREIIKLKGNASGDNLDDPEVDLKIVFGEGWKESKSIFYKTVLAEGELLWKQN